MINHNHNTYNINNSNVFAVAVVLAYSFENFSKVVIQNLHIYNIKYVYIYIYKKLPFIEWATGENNKLCKHKRMLREGLLERVVHQHLRGFTGDLIRFSTRNAFTM